MSFEKRLAASSVCDLFTVAAEHTDRVAIKMLIAGAGDEVAAYFHKDGTTGAPRLVAHTHRNQIAAAYGCPVMQHLPDLFLKPSLIHESH